MNLTGWIIYNGQLPGDKFRDFAQWLQRAAAKQAIQTHIYQNNELLTYISTQQLHVIGETILPDFVIFTDKDIYLAKQLELLGVRVFNRADTIAVSDDKIATYQVLAQHQLPIPKTIIAPKVFFDSATISTEHVSAIIKQLGLPMIMKEAYGSFGEQVYLVHSEKEIYAKIKAIADRPFVFQEFIKTSYGKDIRLHVVGDSVVAAMTRHATDDFRANVTAGGTMKAYQPTEQEESLAIAAAKAIDADFAGVDLLFGLDGTPIICEINSNAHIRNMYTSTNINVADFIIHYIKKQYINKEDVT
ncbi:RimK family alpha-L-glutamate ligase [Lentibacillus sp. N15]|uniref:ATP-grasp domain-containing protein n=1 Tax=Lentibacillus songyuanensis TaxID=3136161 RepID=UPI0031BAC8C9